MTQSPRTICVVIPTRNEEQRIGQTLDEIIDVFRRDNLGRPILIVTDDSTDNTRQIVREKGGIVVNGGGKGLGYAMYRGLKYALDFDPDVIISYDADGQCDSGEIPVFIEALAKNNADLVLGSRFLEPGLVEYRYRLINRTGVIILSRILRGFTGIPLTDSHGGVRAMRPEVVSELEMLGTHTYVQETIIDAAEKGFRIVEIPSVWKKREHGGSRVVGSIPTYIFYTLPILIIRSKQHIKWLYSLGILFVLFAIGYFISILAQQGFDIKNLGSRVPALVAVTAIGMTGIQLFFFGFVLQLIKEIKYSVDTLKRYSRKELR